MHCQKKILNRFYGTRIGTTASAALFGKTPYGAGSIAALADESDQSLSFCSRSRREGESREATETQKFGGVLLSPT